MERSVAWPIDRTAKGAGVLFRRVGSVPMTEQSSFRSVGSVMMVTAHVAGVAYVVRLLGTPSTLAGTLIWVPLTITLAVFLTWPIGRAVATAFEPGDAGRDRTCPRCGRRELRPLIRPGGGLFQPVNAHRCAACWSTFRVDGDRQVEEPGRRDPEPADPTGIEFLSDPLAEGEIRFLEEN
jgi:hypothetical protein